jgi:asparagine synthase (glutamine-hydrolysing)
VLWRTKEGMSDGVSSQKKAWYEIIQDKIDVLITDNEFTENKDKYTHNPPQIKEAYYYRKIFEETFNNRSSILPYYWLPKWSGHIIDPSARVLNVYSEKNYEEQPSRSSL